MPCRHACDIELEQAGGATRTTAEPASLDDAFSADYPAQTPKVYTRKMDSEPWRAPRTAAIAANSASMPSRLRDVLEDAVKAGYHTFGVKSTRRASRTASSTRVNWKRASRRRGLKRTENYASTIAGSEFADRLTVLRGFEAARSSGSRR